MSKGSLAVVPEFMSFLGSANPMEIMDEPDYLTVPLIDQGIVETQHYLNTGELDVKKWRRELKERAPTLYEQLLISDNPHFELSTYVRDYGPINDTIILCIMMAQLGYHRIWNQITSDLTMLVYVMLHRQLEQLDFYIITTRSVFKPYLTAIYLFEHGATISVQSFLHLMDCSDPPSWMRDDCLHYIVDHPAVTHNKEYLNWTDFSFGVFYNRLIHRDPILAAQFLGVRGLPLNRKFNMPSEDGPTTSYLHEAVERYLTPRSLGGPTPEEKDALREIIRRIFIRYSNLTKEDIPPGSKILRREIKYITQE